MTKEVLLSIKGLQFDENLENNTLETITVAKYYKRGNSHYLIYEEAMEGFQETIQNRMKIREDSLEIHKKGLLNVHMIFEKFKKNMTCYSTPYGGIMMGTEASKMELNVSEEKIDFQVEYGLEINYEHLADCKIMINIRPKEDAENILETT